MSLAPEKQDAVSPRRLRAPKPQKARETSKPVVLAQLPHIRTGNRSGTQKDADIGRLANPQIGDNSENNAKQSIRIDESHDALKLVGAKSPTPTTDPNPQPLQAEPTTTPRLPLRPQAESQQQKSPAKVAKSTRSESPRLSIVRETVDDDSIRIMKDPPAPQRVPPPKIRLSDDFTRPVNASAKRSSSAEPSLSRATSKANPQSTPQPTSGLTELIIKAIGVVLAGALILIAARNLKVKSPPVPTASEPVWGPTIGSENIQLQPRVANHGESNGSTDGFAESALTPALPPLTPAEPTPVSAARPTSPTDVTNVDSEFQPTFIQPESSSPSSEWQPRITEPNHLEENSSDDQSLQFDLSNMLSPQPNDGDYPTTSFPGMYPPEDPNASARLNGVIQEFSR